jgi:metal-sulfur cluster biosynthetic enzyme
MRKEKTTFRVMQVPESVDLREVAKRVPLPQVTGEELSSLKELRAWVGPADLADRFEEVRENTEGCEVWGVMHGRPWVQLVGIKREAPKSLVDARTAEIMRLQERAEGRRLGRGERKEVRKHVKEQLDAVAQPALRGVDVIDMGVRRTVQINATGATVETIEGGVRQWLVCSSSANAPMRVQACIGETYPGQQLRIQFPEVATVRTLTALVASAVDGLSDSFQLMIVGGVAFRDVEDGGIDQVAGASKRAYSQWGRYLAQGAEVVRVALALKVRLDGGQTYWVMWTASEAGAVSGWSVRDGGRGAVEPEVAIEVWRAWWGKWEKVMAWAEKAGAARPVPPWTYDLLTM